MIGIIFIGISERAFPILIQENLTPAMALVCVLYLANEKRLELENVHCVWGSLT